MKFALLPAVLALAPPAFTPLPTGATTPKGWLLKQLTLQAEGLSGHLSQFWPDVMNSVWIGGINDGGLHERAPYWLNGYVPLAYLLKNAGITELPGSKGIYLQRQKCADHPTAGPECEDIPAVKPLDQVHAYLDYILSHTNTTSGWLGPDDQKGGNGMWGPSNVLFSLLQYAEAEPAKFEVATKAMLGHLLAVRLRLQKDHLRGWAVTRWVDLAYSVEWLLKNAPQGKEAELEELVGILHKQGQNWDKFFAKPGYMHNVNLAQGIKASAVEYLHDGNASHAADAAQLVKNLDAMWGMPTGMYIGDEITPPVMLHHPSRGIETCGVVEAMFSYNVLFSVHGNPAFADRSEQIAYNAMPATWTSPRGGDMWAHQYLQAVNEIRAEWTKHPIWTHDGAASEMYGLEPNYGCCTANFNQGWPKFANMIFYAVETAGKEGIAVGIWAPASAKTKYGTVEIDTSYPFEDEVTVTVEAPAATKLYLRIPNWATGAVVVGSDKVLQNGTMAEFDVPKGSFKVTIDFKPVVRVEKDGGADMPAFSVHRGALLYSLPIGTNFTQKGHHYAESNDYEVRPTTPWNYALDADVENPGKTLTFVKDRGYVEGAAPFNKTGWPNHIEAELRLLPTWTEVLGSADKVPASPACKTNTCGEPTKLQLVPHGGTSLRIGDFPLSGFTSMEPAVMMV